MFNPTESKDVIAKWIVDVVTQAGANACPPFIVGVGIGGTFETAAILAKKALLKPLEQENEDPVLAQLEQDLLTEINKTGHGAQGLGGRNFCLGVKVLRHPCHIASLPVAVNIDCHAHRHKETIL